MTAPHVEYVTFTTTELAREYHLLIHRGADVHEFVVSVPNDAFQKHRLRFQDGPELCFQKLRQALADGDGVLPKRRLEVTGAECDEYRVAHTPKSSRR